MPGGKPAEGDLRVHAPPTSGHRANLAFWVPTPEFLFQVVPKLGWKKGCFIALLTLRLCQVNSEQAASVLGPHYKGSAVNGFLRTAAAQLKAAD